MEQLCQSTNNLHLAIDDLRGQQESDASWQHRRQFLQVHNGHLPTGRLNQLSYCFCNAIMYACKYSDSLMKELSPLAVDVAVAIALDRGDSAVNVSKTYLWDKIEDRKNSLLAERHYMKKLHELRKLRDESCPKEDVQELIQQGECILPKESILIKGRYPKTSGPLVDATGCENLRKYSELSQWKGGSQTSPTRMNSEFSPLAQGSCKAPSRKSLELSPLIERAPLTPLKQNSPLSPSRQILESMPLRPRVDSELSPLTGSNFSKTCEKDLSIQSVESKQFKPETKRTPITGTPRLLCSDARRVALQAAVEHSLKKENNRSVSSSDRNLSAGSPSMIKPLKSVNFDPVMSCVNKGSYFRSSIDVYSGGNNIVMGIEDDEAIEDEEIDKIKSDSFSGRVYNSYQEGTIKLSSPKQQYTQRESNGEDSRCMIFDFHGNSTEDTKQMGITPSSAPSLIENLKKVTHKGETTLTSPSALTENLHDAATKGEITPALIENLQKITHQEEIIVTSTPSLVEHIQKDVHEGEITQSPTPLLMENRKKFTHQGETTDTSTLSLIKKLKKATNQGETSPISTQSLVQSLQVANEGEATVAAKPSLAITLSTDLIDYCKGDAVGTLRSEKNSDVSHIDEREERVIKSEIDKLVYNNKFTQGETTVVDIKMPLITPEVLECETRSSVKQDHDKYGKPTVKTEQRKLVNRDPGHKKKCDKVLFTGKGEEKGRNVKPKKDLVKYPALDLPKKLQKTQNSVWKKTMKAYTKGQELMSEETKMKVQNNASRSGPKDEFDVSRKPRSCVVSIEKEKDVQDNSSCLSEEFRSKTSRQIELSSTTESSLNKPSRHHPYAVSCQKRGTCDSKTSESGNQGETTTAYTQSLSSADLKASRAGKSRKDARKFGETFNRTTCYPQRTNHQCVNRLRAQESLHKAQQIYSQFLGKKIREESGNEERGGTMEKVEVGTGVGELGRIDQKFVSSIISSTEQMATPVAGHEELTEYAQSTSVPDFRESKPSKSMKKDLALYTDKLAKKFSSKGKSSETTDRDYLKSKDSEKLFLIPNVNVQGQGHKSWCFSTAGNHGIKRSESNSKAKLSSTSLMHVNNDTESTASGFSIDQRRKISAKSSGDFISKRSRSPDVSAAWSNRKTANLKELTGAKSNRSSREDLAAQSKAQKELRKELIFRSKSKSESKDDLAGCSKSISSSREKLVADSTAKSGSQEDLLFWRKSKCVKESVVGREAKSGSKENLASKFKSKSHSHQQTGSRNKPKSAVESAKAGVQSHTMKRKINLEPLRSS
ncbi:transcriptional regulator ATRX-like [Argopecten irradians]|uniref:transcriptional regulator ATRX-like n=1 Tax=Argopecten irradians TaxID=31199 RepID=UPI0037125DE7